MHLHEAAAPDAAFRCIRAFHYRRPFFLLLHEYLDACSAHLADDDRLGGSDADRAAVGLLRANHTLIYFLAVLRQSVTVFAPRQCLSLSARR